MKNFAFIALTIAALASSGANADTVHRHHRASAGMAPHMSAPTNAPTSFQGLYQGGVASNDCEGPRVFGFCNVR
jgi:opacity protein-like surface antigen